VLQNLLSALIAGDDEIISSEPVECSKVRFDNQMKKRFMIVIDSG